MEKHSIHREAVVSCLSIPLTHTSVRPRFQVHPDGRHAIGRTKGSALPAIDRPLSALGSGIHIRAALDFMARTDEITFARIVRRLWEFADAEQRQTLVYYLVLFRGEPHVRALLTQLPAALADALVGEAFSRTERGGENAILEEILGLLPQETLFDLALRNDAERREEIVLNILLKMDVKHLDRFFEDTGRVSRFITGICAMPQDMIKSFFFRNPKLHGYYVFLFHAIDSSSIANADELCMIDLSEVEAAQQLTNSLRIGFDLERELALPLPQRDKERFARIVKSIRRFTDVRRVLDSLVDEGVIDGGERSLIGEILVNPLFRDVLEKYSAAPKLEESVVFDFML